MVFSVINKDSKSRRNLTDLLLSMYPGSVVHELKEILNVISCLREHRIDAVIWDLSENPAQDLSPLNMITQLHQGTLFFICAEDDTLLDEAMWNGASMYFVKPLLPEQLRTALEAIKKV